MLNSNQVFILGAILTAGWLMGGCASPKQVASTDVPVDALSQKADLKHEGNYDVKPKDCLWTIAGKKSVYGDPFEWPLLFKSNRDMIKDPDLIYPHQHLKYVKSVTADMKNRAKKLASETPHYKEHHEPQETLKVSYF
jgi:hypothetical protein